MLEPRRLAAKSAARHMAHLLGEPCGQRVGYRMRLESCVSAATRITVVTEGVLTRMLQDDPELTHVGCVIFDEFHERSLHADTGLALCLEVQQALRPDLRLLVMSATLDSEAVAQLLGNCPVHVSQGRCWDVDIRHLPPRTPHIRLEDHVAAVLRHVLHHEQGSVLVFLPGTAEIRRVESLLGPEPAPHVAVYPLYGELPPARQDAALAPCTPPQRKVVLSTSIAETSLTIEGVRVVVDAGLSRTSVFDPFTGMGRLVTQRVSLAEARQRAGRAGRTEPGIAYRLWAAEEDIRLRPFARPEILEADLAPLVLQLAQWGVHDPATLAWLDAPPEAALRQARSLLQELEALATSPGHGTHNEDAVLAVQNPRLALTAHGVQLASVPLHPRLGHMLLKSPHQEWLPLACCVAALMHEPLRKECDVRHMVAQLCGSERHGAEKSASMLKERLRRQARVVAKVVARLMGRPAKLQATSPLCQTTNLTEDRSKDSADKGKTQDNSTFDLLSLPDNAFFAAALDCVEDCGLLLALAWPQWLAQKVGPGQFRMRNGRMAVLPEEEALAHESWLAVAALDNRPGRARIFAAAPVRQADVESLFAAHCGVSQSVVWDARTEAVLARRQHVLGALVLQDSPLPLPDTDACVAAVIQGITALGLHVLPWTEDLRQWQARVLCLRRLSAPAEAEAWPDVSDAALLHSLDQWLSPFLHGISRRTHFRQIDLAGALHAFLPWEWQKKLEREAPSHVEVPSGSQLRIDYTAAGGPVLAVKLQEMFGCAVTPRIAGGRLALTLHLNSPAGRPLQVTQDLESFWATGYAAVRAEMRGRYPKHPWPENPATALPTRHTKARAHRLAASEHGTK